MTKTITTKASDIKRNWRLFDVKNKILGRVGTEIAGILIGKSKPYFVHNLDCGDYVVVINSASVSVTGKKMEQKIYRHYSGFPGGQKKKTLKQVLIEHPEKVIRQAVSGMLPKNKLRDSMLRRLYIFPDGNHPYKAKFSNFN